MKTAFVFPGQGSQAVGMGAALAEAFPEARDVLARVDAALGQPLSQLMADGPADDLTLTSNAQPALMAVSLAAIAALETKGVSVATHADYVAGHSLGEYSALAAAGAFDVETAAKLLRTRGDAMQSAVLVGEGAMAAILNLDFGAVEQIAKDAAQGEVCQAANDNAPGQVVISGHKAAVDRAIDLAKAAGAKRALLLPVSAPFHCALMEPAAQVMATALADAAMQPPAEPVVANVLAAPISDPEAIRSRLVDQVTGRVRWRESVEWLAADGVDTFVEIGAGKALSGMIRRMVDGATILNVATPEDVDRVAEHLSR
ncbi:MAG: ACP S-malonyltransferase [Devosiaceae bacterium]|nr:ACP S-malonyltransferase [Devosiaceae bacterium MH13]